MDSIITGIFAIIGVIIGSLSTYIVNKQNRKDKFQLAYIDKKFDVSQKAYSLSGELSSVINTDNEKRYATVMRAQDWFDNNNLYLEPKIRDDFEDIIDIVYSFQNKRDCKDMHIQQKQTKEADRLQKEISDDFKKITGLKKRIKNSINVYYKY